MRCCKPSSVNAAWISATAFALALAAFRCLLVRSVSERTVKVEALAYCPQTFSGTSFFAMLFGSEPFEHLIGELKLATLFALGGEADEQLLAYKQKRRELLCALTLKGLLGQFECGDETEFETDMHAEAAALRERGAEPFHCA